MSPRAIQGIEHLAVHDIRPDDGPRGPRRGGGLPAARCRQCQQPAEGGSAHEDATGAATARGRRRLQPPAPGRGRRIAHPRPDCNARARKRRAPQRLSPSGYGGHQSTHNDGLSPSGQELVGSTASECGIDDDNDALMFASSDGCVRGVGQGAILKMMVMEVVHGQPA